MKITLSKNQWEQMGKKAGWMKTAQPVQQGQQPQQQEQLYTGYPTQERNTEYINGAAITCSRTLSYWASEIPKMVQEVLKQNPNAQINDFKNSILELDHMEEDMATAIAKLIQTYISQGFMKV